MRRGWSALWAPLLLACASDHGANASGLERVPNGEWGGRHARLSVSDEGAKVELDCAHGAVESPLQLDAEGRFDVAGRLVLEGGPEREGVEDPGRPVRYAGRTDGRDLTLEIVFEGGRRQGPFRLGLGRPPRLFKCQ